MSANDQIDFPACDVREGLGYFLLAPEAAKEADLYAKALEPLDGHFEMLSGQYGGRAKQGGLITVLDSPEYGLESHLGLPKAHVSGDEPVHGMGGGHVLGNGIPGRDLGTGQRVGEALGEFTFHRPVLGEGNARGRSPFGVDVKQPVGQKRHPRLYLGLPSGPSGATDYVQGRLGGLGSGIFPYLPELEDGDIERGTLGVLDLQVIQAIHYFHALVDANAVVFVHDVVARLKVRILLDGLEVLVAGQETRATEGDAEYFLRTYEGSLVPDPESLRQGAGDYGYLVGLVWIYGIAQSHGREVIGEGRYGILLQYRIDLALAFHLIMEKLVRFIHRTVYYRNV